MKPGLSPANAAGNFTPWTKPFAGVCATFKVPWLATAPKPVQKTTTTLPRKLQIGVAVVAGRDGCYASMELASPSS